VLLCRKNSKVQNVKVTFWFNKQLLGKYKIKEPDNKKVKKMKLTRTERLKTQTKNKPQKKVQSIFSGMREK